MYTPIVVALLTLLLQVLPPFKASEEFKLELEYKFKPRPVSDNAYIDLTETVKEKEKRVSGGNPLPYLIIHLSFLQLSDKEVRVRCFDNKGKNKLSRKVETDRDYLIDLGFTDDMKDRTTAHEFNLSLLSDDKVETSRIHLIVEADGTFLVNGVKRGKF